MSDTKPPIHKIKIGLIEVAIWEQQGDKGNFLTFSHQRSYVDNDNNWKQTQSYRKTDIPQLQMALTKALEYAELEYRKGGN